MSCNVLSVVQCVAAAGCCGGLPVPGANAIAGGLAGALPGGAGAALNAGLNAAAGGAGGLGGALAGASGLGVADGLTSCCSGFASSGIGGLAQTCLGSCGVNVQDALKSLPAGITGCVPASLQSLIPANMNFPINDVIGGVLQQGQSFLQNGIPGLTDAMSAVKGFCENGFNLQGSLMQAAGINLAGGDLGHLSKSITDLCTGGFSNQFGDLVGQQFKDLTAALPNLGSMCNPQELLKSFTPSGLAENLINQGFSNEIMGRLEKVGLSSVSDLIDGNDSLISRALGSMPSDIVNKIVDTTGFKTAAGSVLGSLTDVLKPAIALGGAAALIGNSFDNFSNKLTNVVGTSLTSSNWADTAKFMGSIEKPNLNYLNGLGNDTTRYQAVLNPPDLQKITGTGSGPFGTPTMNDVMGSVSGAGYIEAITALNASQAAILATEQGQALQTALQAAYDNRNETFYDLQYARDILTAAQPFIQPTDDNIRQHMNIANRAAEEVFHRLLLEKKNLAIAGVNPADTTGSVSTVMGFVMDLHEVHNDGAQIGIREFIEAVAAPNVYGEAIKAAIVEGKNIATMRSQGIEFVQRMNPVAYLQQLQNRPDGRCCP